MNKAVLRLTRILVLAGLVAASGCATIGNEFPTAQVSMIKIGETSQDQIRAMFGKPWRVGTDSGQLTWTYGHYQYSLFGHDSTEDLLIRFDHRNIVTSYVFNTTKQQVIVPAEGQ